MLKHDFPEIITNLPKADIPFDGIRGWIAQGNNHQIVFFEINPSAIVPEHSHDAQWGIVVEGEIELTIDNRTRVYRKGETYFIPPQTIHSAKFLTKCRIIDFFVDKDRFKPKSNF